MYCQNLIEQSFLAPQTNALSFKLRGVHETRALPAELAALINLLIIYKCLAYLNFTQGNHFLSFKIFICLTRAFYRGAIYLTPNIN
jgi:hypothetical protein